MKIRARIDVIVVCFNSDYDLLRLCLDSVKRAYEHGDFSGTIILVDNASAPPLADSPAFMHERIITMPSNVGFGRAVNRGVAESDAEFILMLNPDAATCLDGLTRMYEASQSHTRSLVGGWLEQGGRVQSDAYMQWDFSLGRLWRRSKFATELADFDGDVLEVEKVCGGALFAKRDVLIELGPFDERFFLYGEDADLSRRAQTQGVALILARHARVEHIAASSQRTYGELVERARADAAIRLTAYHRSKTISILQRVELMLVTVVGAVAGGASSSTRRSRLARLGQIRRWGLSADMPSFSP